MLLWLQSDALAGFGCRNGSYPNLRLFLLYRIETASEANMLRLTRSLIAVLLLTLCAGCAEYEALPRDYQPQQQTQPQTRAAAMWSYLSQHAV
jgi:hypothetical protein